MFIIVVGARERKRTEDEQQVNKVLDTLSKKYGRSMTIVSATCDAGIGGFIKQRCLKNSTDFQFIEIAFRVFADLPRSRMIQVYKSRNATLADLGDEFHIFQDPEHPATMDDLVARLNKMAAAGNERPMTIYNPGDEVGE